jgi:hypothetical protein
MRKIFILIIIIFTALNVSGQSNNLELVILSAKHVKNIEEADIYEISVAISNKKGYQELIQLTNYREDFKFLCRYFDDSNDEIFVFSNYDSPTGGTKLYFLDIKNNNVYSSKFLSEFLVPRYFTFNKEKHTMKCMSIDFNNCGEISYYPIKSLNKSEKQFDNLNDFIILKSIKL